MYAFLTGPMFWISIAVFVIGLGARALWYVRGLHWQLDRVAYRAHPKAGMRGAARSVFRWLVPFGTYGWRTQPFMTVAFFLFHIGAVLVPVFFAGSQRISPRANRPVPACHAPGFGRPAYLGGTGRCRDARASKNRPA